MYTAVQLWGKTALTFSKQNESHQHFKRGWEDLSTMDRFPGKYFCVDCRRCWLVSEFGVFVMLGACVLHALSDCTIVGVRNSNRDVLLRKRKTHGNRPANEKGIC